MWFNELALLILIFLIICLSLLGHFAFLGMRINYMCISTPSYKCDNVEIVWLNFSKSLIPVTELLILYYLHALGHYLN